MHTRQFSNGAEAYGVQILAVIKKILHNMKRSERDGIIKIATEWLQGNASKYIHGTEYDAQSMVNDLKAHIEYETVAKPRNEKNFLNGCKVSWNEMPLDIRKHDYPYYFDKDGNDCYPLMP